MYGTCTVHVGFWVTVYLLGICKGLHTQEQVSICMPQGHVKSTHTSSNWWKKITVKISCPVTRFRIIEKMVEVHTKGIVPLIGCAGTSCQNKLLGQVRLYMWTLK